METQKQHGKVYQAIWYLHLKISSLVAKLIGPMVFNFGIKEEPWNLSTADLLQYPRGSVGRSVGEFLKKDQLEPIARAESHDVLHVLLGYSVTFKDEVAMQFFLKGNGNTSIASFLTSIGAWIVLPTQWSYLRTAYTRGKNCADVSKLNYRAVLNENLEAVKLKLFKKYIPQISQITTDYASQI
jgi:ubiquinone biosynthesis protein Coq4